MVSATHPPLQVCWLLPNRTTKIEIFLCFARCFAVSFKGRVAGGSVLASNGVQSGCVLARVMPDNAWRAVAVHFGAADGGRRGLKQLPSSEESRRKTLKICSNSRQNPQKRRFLPFSCSTTPQTHQKRRFLPISCSTTLQMKCAPFVGRVNN